MGTSARGAVDGKVAEPRRDRQMPQLLQVEQAKWSHVGFESVIGDDVEARQRGSVEGSFDSRRRQAVRTTFLAPLGGLFEGGQRRGEREDADVE